MQEPFTIEIAGLSARVQPLFVSTRDFCRNYLTDRGPEIYVEVTEADLAQQQESLRQEALEEGMRVRKFTDPFLERATIQYKIALALLDRQTILFHGSTVAVDDAAYLFTAPCGTGKSTHTRFWRETFGSRAVMVNDDKAFLRITPAGVFAYGSPWSGKHGLDTNICLPLKGICFLQRGQENRIKRASPDDYIEELRHQTMVPEEPTARDKALALAEELSQRIALWEMECTKDPSAAMVSYKAMSGLLQK